MNVGHQKHHATIVITVYVVGSEKPAQSVLSDIHFLVIPYVDGKTLHP
jgi:hypothetical protein